MMSFFSHQSSWIPWILRTLVWMTSVSYVCDLGPSLSSGGLSPCCSVSWKWPGRQSEVEGSLTLTPDLSSHPDSEGQVGRGAPWGLPCGNHTP